MPMIDTIPCSQGLTEEQLNKKIDDGWVLVGRQSVNTGIARPDSPGGTVDVDIWMIPEPMMPQRVVMQALVSYYQNVGGKQVLDQLCKAWFDVGIERLDEVVTEMTQQEGEDA